MSVLKTLSPLNIKPFGKISEVISNIKVYHCRRWNIVFPVRPTVLNYFLQFLHVFDNESDIEGVNMLSDLPISEQRISEIQQHTLNDEHMQELKEVIQNGWPNRKYDVPPSAMIYFDVRDDLTYFSKWFDIHSATVATYAVIVSCCMKRFLQN
jgi:hypothetical protein